MIITAGGQDRPELLQQQVGIGFEIQSYAEF